MEIQEVTGEDGECESFYVFNKSINRRTAVFVDDLDKDKELKIVEQTLLPHLEALT